jgi:hypothetical protein
MSGYLSHTLTALDLAALNRGEAVVFTAYTGDLVKLYPPGERGGYVFATQEEKDAALASAERLREELEQRRSDSERDDRSASPQARHYYAERRRLGR